MQAVILVGGVFLIKGYADLQHFLVEKKLQGSLKHWKMVYSLEAALESINREELC